MTERCAPCSDSCRCAIAGRLKRCVVHTDTRLTRSHAAAAFCCLLLLAAPALSASHAGYVCISNCDSPILLYHNSVVGVGVSISAFQAGVPGSSPGRRMSSIELLFCIRPLLFLHGRGPPSRLLRGADARGRTVLFLNHTEKQNYQAPGFKTCSWGKKIVPYYEFPIIRTSSHASSNWVNHS